MVTATINANVRLEVHLSKMKSKVESRGQQRQNYGYMHVGYMRNGTVSSSSIIRYVAMPGTSLSNAMFLYVLGWGGVQGQVEGSG